MPETACGTWRGRSSKIAAWALMGTLGLYAAACRPEKLVESLSELGASTSQLDFGPRYPGQEQVLSFDLYNRGRATLDVRLRLESAQLGSALVEGPVFMLLTSPSRLDAGGTRVEVRFSPAREGTFDGVLVAEAEGQTLSVQLRGVAAPVPSCAPQDGCHTAAFDLAAGTCVQTGLPDGTSCGANNACLMEAKCQAGVCVGQAVACNDGNACTQDVCDPLLGCQFPPAPPCPGDGVCQVGTCDPTKGCGLTAAQDGTTCGELTCDAANVCIAGACVVRNPPDGFICAEASPCQGEGRCQGSTCARTAAAPLLPDWKMESAKEPYPTELHDFVLEGDGSVSLMGFFERPRLRANQAAPVAADTFARRCIVWNQRLACADYAAQGTVGVLDLSTGKRLWSYDIVVNRPDFYAKVEPGRMFMARVASLGPDRLAAVFEAFPAGSSEGTQCRTYFVVILDGQGRAVHAQQLQDPLLDVCNHPHPFGVASDKAGNLFMAFSPTTTDAAPLYSGNPTLLLSFSRDGAFKWKRTETSLYGGELAVSNGLLFPERSATAYQANSGEPVNQVTLSDGRFGRVGITDRHVIPSPLGSFSVAGTRELVAYHFNGARAWTHSLKGNDVFVSDQLRLAGWRSTPSSKQKTVALVFRSQNGSPALTAVDTATGAESWTCPVAHDPASSPQLFEVARNQLAVMERAETCGACDPPFANSSASFFSFNVPGLDTARVPWPGAFGGADHDHHEDVVIPQDAP